MKLPSKVTMKTEFEASPVRDQTGNKIWQRREEKKDDSIELLETVGMKSSRSHAIGQQIKNKTIGLMKTSQER